MSASERSSLIRSTPSELLNNYIAISSQIHVEGRTDEMKSSPVRRTFCLLVLFDLVLCTLVWFGYVQTSYNSFRKEVVEYKFNSSLFDTVVVAALRFTFLEIVYGGVKSKFTLWIALSTAVSTGFVICKIFKQYLPHSNMTTYNLSAMEYITILLAFVLSWVETIFLVYRMLPKERAAEQIAEYHRTIARQFSDSRDSLASDISIHIGDDKRTSPLLSTDDQFFSPITTRPTSPTHARLKEIQSNAINLQEKALEIIRNKSGWTYVTGDAIKGFVTYKELVSFKGKLFKLETLLDVSAHNLYYDMINNYEQSSLWNPHVRLVKRIETISENVDILYNLSNEALKGYISPRDYVLLRTWVALDNCYLISMTSFLHDDCPVQKDIVRGEYGIGAIFLQNSSIDVGQCKCIWLMNNDIKGKLFKTIVDKAVPGILFEIMEGLRQHCSLLMGTI